MQYFDKNGKEIKAGMKILMEDGSIEMVYDTEDQYGNPNLGINASNEEFLKLHPNWAREYYSLSMFKQSGIEVCPSEQEIRTELEELAPIIEGTELALDYKAIYGEEGGLNYGDLREIDPKQLPDFELLCAGFPCQSFSVAGRRLGFQDTRGTVFFEIARIIAEKRPSFLLLENVPGLLSHDGGRTLTTIFSSLVEMGYHLEWMVLNSKYFGVPQQRRRLYIVGYLDARCAGKVFPLGSSYAKNLKQLIPGAQGQRVYETDGVACTQCASAGGWGGKTGLYFIDMNVNPKITEVARCITARQDSGVSNHRGEHSAVLIEDEPPRAMLTPDREKVRQQGRRLKEPDEPMFTITAQDKHGIYHKERG